MTTIVLSLNGLMAMLCLYAAWQLCRLRTRLASTADVLIAVERSSQRILVNAPQTVATGQLGAFQLRQQYRLLVLLLQQVQQLLTLLGLGQLAWRYYQARQSPFRANPSQTRRRSNY
jgi:hypothetical protein